MAGWLHKRGNSFSTGLRRRFFVLDGHHVSYYKLEPTESGLTRPQGSFTLTYASVRPRGYCGFDVDVDGQRLVGGRIFFLEAESREHRDLWVAALTIAVEDCNRSATVEDGTGCGDSPPIARLSRQEQDEDEDEDAFLTDASGRGGCGSRCRRVCSADELTKRTRHALGPMAELIDGATIFIVSRVWSDAYQQVAYAEDASAAEQYRYAAYLAPFAVLLRHLSEREDGSARSPHVRWLPEMASTAVGWCCAGAALQQLRETNAAHPDLCRGAAAAAANVAADPETTSAAEVASVAANSEAPSGCALVDASVSLLATALAAVLVALLKPAAERRAAACAATSLVGVARLLEHLWLVWLAACTATLSVLWYDAASRAVGVGLHDVGQRTRVEMISLWATLLLLGGAVASSKLEEVDDALRARLGTGLRWQGVGKQPPAVGRRRTHRRLAEALRHKTEFTRAELAALEVRDLRCDDFIHVDDLYLRPAEGQPTYGFLVRHGLVATSRLVQHAAAYVAGCALLDLATALLDSLGAAPLSRPASAHSSALGWSVLGANLGVAASLSAGALLYLLINGRGEGSAWRLGAAFQREPPVGERPIERSLERFFLTATLGYLVGGMWLVVGRDALAEAVPAVEALVARTSEQRWLGPHAALPREAAADVALVAFVPAMTAVAWLAQSGLASTIGKLCGATREDEERNRRTLERHRCLALYARVRVQLVAAQEAASGRASTGRSILKKGSRSRLARPLNDLL